MQIGMVGLGRMGGNMLERLRADGHEVLGFDPHSEVANVGSLDELAGGLSTPRVVWVMVPSGIPTEQTVGDLIGLLGDGDVIVEGGNSRWSDSIRRGETAAEKGIGYIDAGVSGGIWGREYGYALMVGGSDEDVAKALPAFKTLAPSDGGYAHVGPLGAGHFTKMVHNGVEYALMQAYAEGYELLARSARGIDVDAALDCWRTGSVVRSWLLDLLVKALEERPEFDGIAPVAADSGEGRWTVQSAIDVGVPVPTIASALFARFTSQDVNSPAMRAVAALRQQFGGHPLKETTGDSTPPVGKPGGDA